MPHPNHPLGAHRYWQSEAWVTREGGFLLWPAVWLRLGQERGLWVRQSFLTFGWGTFRWRLTLGQDHTPDVRRTPQWEEVDGDRFLAWAQATFGGTWDRPSAQAFFRRHPRWRNLVTQGGLQAHYVRVLLAREMLAEAPVAVATD
jgi:hypothetical protein